ncbi:MAG: hypothetical protein K2W95_23740 [Candidatus Obscuribacterales bacterium]|nr:hypothetical protein [Candidatus Obscuribacterales bacterium]
MDVLTVILYLLFVCLAVVGVRATFCRLQTEQKQAKMLDLNENKNPCINTNFTHFGEAALLWLPLTPQLFLTLFWKTNEADTSAVPGTLLIIFFLVVPGLLGLWESSQFLQNKGLASCCQRGRIVLALSLCSIPWFLVLPSLSSSCVYPIMVGLFSKSWIGWVLLVGAVIWQAISCMLLVRNRSFGPTFWVLWLGIVPSGLAIMFFPLLAPALWTIMGIASKH